MILGYGCWWQVEHHGASEFSISSTPELFNTLVAQQFGGLPHELALRSLKLVEDELRPALGE